MLPKENMVLLRRVLGLLSRVAQRSQTNKMTASNLALMFASSFLRAPGQGAEAFSSAGRLIFFGDQ